MATVIVWKTASLSCLLFSPLTPLGEPKTNKPCYCCTVFGSSPGEENRRQNRGPRLQVSGSRQCLSLCSEQLRACVHEPGGARLVLFPAPRVSWPLAFPFLETPVWGSLSSCSAHTSGAQCSPRDAEVHIHTCPASPQLQSCGQGHRASRSELSLILPVLHLCSSLFSKPV